MKIQEKQEDQVVSPYPAAVIKPASVLKPTKTNALSGKIIAAKTETSLDVMFKNYAELALQELRSGMYDSFDPLVGEQACHLRAFRMILISQKIEQNLSLTEDDSKFLGACYLLKNQQQQIRGPFDHVLRRESLQEKLLAPYEHLGKNKIKKIILDTKTYLAKSSVDYLQSHYPKSLYLKPYTHSLTQHDVPCLPLFMAYYHILEHFHRHNIPLLIEVERYRVHKDGMHHYLGKGLIEYQPKDGGKSYSYRIIGIEEKHSKAYFCVSGFSVTHDETVSLLDFLSEFMKQNPIAHTLLSAASHCQLPTKGKKADYEEKYAVANHHEVETYLTGKAPFIFPAIDQIESFYRAFRSYAEQRSLMDVCYATMRNDQLERFDKEVPFMVSHVFVSSKETLIQEHQRESVGRTCSKVISKEDSYVTMIKNDQKLGMDRRIV